MTYIYHKYNEKHVKLQRLLNLLDLVTEAQMGPGSGYLPSGGEGLKSERPRLRPGLRPGSRPGSKPGLRQNTQTRSETRTETRTRTTDIHHVYCTHVLKTWTRTKTWTETEIRPRPEQIMFVGPDELQYCHHRWRSSPRTSSI